MIAREGAEHPAVRAWRKLEPASAGPESVQLRRERASCAIYRLTGVGSGGTAVFAKRCRASRAPVERAVYAEILPLLPVTSPRCYGIVEDDGGSCWLFLEDVGNERYAASDPEQCALAGRWLGLMHTSTTMVADAATAAARLPDGGPGRYLGHLRSARADILRNLSNPALTAEEVALLGTLASQLDLLERRWGWLEESCPRVPSTLVHGDFRPKNAYIRRDQGEARLFPIDWEMAGWGVPAADLTRVDVTAYWEVVREPWSVDLPAVRRLGAVGQVFRFLAAISWASPGLAYDSPEFLSLPVADMRALQARLSDAVRAADEAA
jgi:hypothetical protein